MTEFEKKQSGLIYDARDLEIRKQYNFAKKRVKIYNDIPVDDMDIRNKVLKTFIGSIGENVRINQPFLVDYGYNIKIGRNCIINMNCTFLDTGEISIGDNVLIGPDVKIYTATHPINGNDRFWEPDMAVKTSTGKVKIGDYTWIGGGSIILPNVEIGKNVVIGAGSVVTKNIPDNAIAVGNPCEVINWNEPLK